MKEHGAKALKRLKAAWTRLVKSNLPRVSKVSSREMMMRRAPIGTLGDGDIGTTIGNPIGTAIGEHPGIQPQDPWPEPLAASRGRQSTTADTMKTIVCQDLEFRNFETITCGGGCGRKVTAYSGFRCRQCFVFFCGQCALDHFGLVVEPSTGRVLDARS